MTDERAVRRRRITIVVVAAVVAAVIVVVLVALLAPQQTPRQTAGTATPSSGAPSGPTETAAPTSASTSTPAPTGGTDATPGAGSDGPSPTSLAPGGELAGPTLAPGGSASLPDGPSFTVTGIDDVSVTGAGRGETDGPGIRVAVTVRNTTSSAFDLSSVAVNAYGGSDDAPASPSTGSAAASPLRGSLAPGATARGVYVFRMPADARGHATVTIATGASSTALVVHR